MQIRSKLIDALIQCTIFMLIVPAQGHQAGRGAVVFIARGIILGSAGTVGAFVVTCVLLCSCFDD